MKVTHFVGRRRNSKRKFQPDYALPCCKAIIGSVCHLHAVCEEVCVCVRLWVSVWERCVCVCVTVSVLCKCIVRFVLVHLTFSGARAKTKHVMSTDSTEHTCTHCYTLPHILLHLHTHSYTATHTHTHTCLACQPATDERLLCLHSHPLAPCLYLSSCAIVLGLLIHTQAEWKEASRRGS